MSDLVVRGIDGLLLERIRRLSFSRGWSQREAVAAVLDCGLFYIDGHPANGFVGEEIDVLQEAIDALQRLPAGGSY